MSTNKNLRLISSTVGEKNSKSFKLIPETCDTPFNEVIYNPDFAVLALISKQQKDTHVLVEKLNDEGQPELNKLKTAYKSQRVTLPKYYEHYLTVEAEIVDFIESHAINASTFDFKALLVTPNSALTVAA